MLRKTVRIAALLPALVAGLLAYSPLLAGDRLTDRPVLKRLLERRQDGEGALRSGETEHRIGDRKYLVHVPSSYDGSRPVPLLLFFHGGGGHMEQAAEDYGWREKAEREGFLVAFPNGSSPLPRQHLATWNAGRCCGYARDNDADDIGFVRAVVADIQAQATVDTRRIFAAGMSNGGMFAYRLACEMPETFRAVASVAGTDNTVSCVPVRPVSILHIHALDDTHVLFDGGAGQDAFRDQSKVTEFTSVGEAIRRWVDRDRLNPKPQRILDVPGAHADLYTSPSSRVQVELVVTDTGGHSWPGGQSVRGKQPSQSVNANELIWDFFMRQGQP